MEQTHRQTVHALNALLRGELSAVEGYQRALSLQSIDEDSRIDLDECRASHARRILRLQAEVFSRGGLPTTSAGTWGALVCILLATARILGMLIGWKAIAHLLHAGEVYGLNRYDKVWGELDMGARKVVTAHLFPQQVLTCQSMSLLRESLKQSPEAQTS